MLNTELDMILLVAEPEKPIRDFSHQETIRARITATIARLNAQSDLGMNLPLALSDDGRVRGLFSRRDALYDIIDEIREAGAPQVHFRFAAARGRIESNLAKGIQRGNGDFGYERFYERIYFRLFFPVGEKKSES